MPGRGLGAVDAVAPLPKAVYTLLGSISSWLSMTVQRDTGSASKGRSHSPAYGGERGEGSLERLVASLRPGEGVGAHQAL